MLRKGITIQIIAVLFLAIVVARPASAEIEWSLKKQLNIEAEPRDVAVSSDGKWIYILTQGEILLYSNGEGKIVKRVPVAKSVDRMTYSAADNVLIVASSSGKTMDVIQLEQVYSFALEGVPFEGAKNASVTLVVFSDYQ